MLARMPCSLPASASGVHGSSSKPLIEATLVELLAVYCYDIRINQGEGNAETPWTLAKMATTLSCLCCYRSLREAAIAFVRRVMSRAMLRSYDLAKLCLWDVTLLLRGGLCPVIRALLYFKNAFDHSEAGLHVFSGIFIDPLIRHCLENYGGGEALAGRPLPSSGPSRELAALARALQGELVGVTYESLHLPRLPWEEDETEAPDT